MALGSSTSTLPFELQKHLDSSHSYIFPSTDSPPQPLFFTIKSSNTSFCTTVMAASRTWIGANTLNGRRLHNYNLQENVAGLPVPIYAVSDQVAIYDATEAFVTRVPWQVMNRFSAAFNEVFPEPAKASKFVLFWPELWRQPSKDALELVLNWMVEMMPRPRVPSFRVLVQLGQYEFHELVDFYAAALTLELWPGLPFAIVDDIFDFLNFQPPKGGALRCIHERLPLRNVVMTRCLTSFFEHLERIPLPYTEEEISAVEEYCWREDFALWARFQQLARARPHVMHRLSRVANRPARQLRRTVPATTAAAVPGSANAANGQTGALPGEHSRIATSAPPHREPSTSDVTPSPQSTVESGSASLPNGQVNEQSNDHGGSAAIRVRLPPVAIASSTNTTAVASPLQASESLQASAERGDQRPEREADVTAPVNTAPAIPATSRSPPNQQDSTDTRSRKARRKENQRAALAGRSRKDTNGNTVPGAIPARL